MEDGAHIRFSNLRSIEKIPEDLFPSQKEKALLDALGAQISLDEGAGELILFLPDGVEH
jgi:hypothetical protein